ncbi:MAG TPA: hypothetical protein VL422_16705 [Miltoncostaea sp.]|nr:hypothetical protein [Miltoncostaea sp.]
MRRSGLIALVVMVLAALVAGCGGGDDDAGGSASSPAAPTTAALTTDTPCSEWLAAADDAKTQALESPAAFTDGGINAWIAETRRTLAGTPQDAATVPDTIPVTDGVALVDRACAAVAPTDTVAQAIPAITYADQHGSTTAP